jgi:uncharacterized protein YdbL (DUF1318 family)
MTLSRIVAAAVALAPLAPAAGQPQAALGSAIRAGQVGERYDGYMGYVAPTVSPAVRRQVSAVNIQRRNLYIDLASRRKVSAQAVGLATACELIAHLNAGQAYMLGDNVWRRVAPGQTGPTPDYCR